MHVFHKLLERLNKRAVLTVLAIITLIIGFGQIIMRGAPFEASKQFIYKNKIINSQLGSIKDISLSIFGSLEESGAYGIASYKLAVNGEKENGVVYLEMEKQSGEWIVVRANLILPNNPKITLK